MSNTEAIPVAVSATIEGSDMNVAGVALTRSIGELAKVALTVHADGEGIPISESTIEQFAARFRDAVLLKSDAEPNVQVTVQAGAQRLQFAGILSGTSSNISAGGSVNFQVSAVERNRMLAGMNLNAYPSGTSGVDTIASNLLGESTAPFVASAQPRGSISERLLALYRTAKKEYSRGSSGSALAFQVQESQRAQNELLEEVFISAMTRSDTNPEWLQAIEEPINTQLNNMLSRMLFQSNRNLWDALLMIANTTGMVYVGNFDELGGRFRSIEFESLGGPDLLSAGVSGRSFRMSKSYLQPIAQIVAMGPSDANTALPFSNLISRRTDQLRACGRFPEEPNPATGQIISLTLPSFLVPSLRVEPRSPDAEGDEKRTLDQARAAAANWAEKRGLDAERAESSNPLITRWCRQQYRRLATSGVQTSVGTPFTPTALEPGAAASAGSLAGILSSVSHTLSINGKSGQASSAFNLSHVDQ